MPLVNKKHAKTGAEMQCGRGFWRNVKHKLKLSKIDGNVEKCIS